VTATPSLARERVRAIADGPARPEEALEEALRVLVEAADADAGAICLYDEAEAVLRLAVERGLSDDGCLQLRTVRDGVGWETPLHTVRDRRPYVVRNAPGNPHVPPLVEPVDAVRTIACLPLARSGYPLGTLVLVASAPRSLPTRTLRELRPALRALVAIIGGIRRRGSATPPPLPETPPASALESLAALALRGVEPVLREAFGMLSAALPLVALPADSAGRVAALERGLADAERERRVLVSRLDAAAAAQVDLAGRHAAELGRVAARLAEAVGRADALQRELVAADARDASEREDGIRRAVDAARAAEDARAAAIAEVETLRAAMASAQAAIMAAEDDARRARAETGRMQAAARALADERDRLSQALDAMRAREQQLQAEVVDTERHRETVWAESERLVAEARTREDAHAARAAQLEDAVAAARSRLSELAADRDRLQREADDAVARAQRTRDDLLAEIARNAAERDDLLQRAVAATRTAEETRAAGAAEIETLRGAGVAAETALLAVQSEAHRARADAARFEAAARAAEAETARVRAESESARAVADQARARLAELEYEAREATEERTRAELAADEREAESDERWAVSLHQAETMAAQERARAEQATAAEARLALELQDAVARERRTRAELEAMLAQSAVERDETLRRALDGTRTAEEARTAAVAEVEATRRTLVELRATIVTAEDDARRLAGEAERFEEACATLAAERDRIAIDLREALAREQEDRARLGQLVAEVDGMREQLARQDVASAERQEEAAARWAARLAEAERDAVAAREQLTDVVRARDGVQDDLRDALARERQLRGELDAVVARTETDRQETLRQALENTRAAEDARAVAAGDAEATRAALAEARAAAAAAEGEAERVGSDLRRIETAYEAARAEVERMARELEEARAAEQEARARLHAAASVSPAPDPVVARPAPRAPRAVPSTRAASSLVVVLDVDPAWAAIGGADGAPVVVPPEPAALDRIRELAPGHVVANLAVPGVLEAARAVSTSGADVVLHGYLGVAGAARVLPLGRVAVAGSPLDPDEVLTLVGTFAARAVRVLIAGNDADPCLSLRHALTRSGMSVSIAWDGKQATDLLAMVRPELVVVDLGLPRGDGYALVADLAGVDPAPATVLVPRGAAGTGFAAVLRDRLDGDRAVTPTQLLSTLRAPS
jgi:CheY-like chemotaxis protein